MQDLMANGNYAPYLAQALTPPMLGAAGMMSGYGGTPGIAPQFGSPGLGNPGFGQFGQGQYGQGQYGQGQVGQGNNPNPNWAGGLTGHQGFGQQLGQPQQVAAQQQQQIAATLHQLAHYVASRTAIGQQIGATLHQLAQHCNSQVIAGQQFAQVLNQLAHQCAWAAQAARADGFGTQAVYGLPFGSGQPYGQMASFNHVGGFNRPVW